MTDDRQATPAPAHAPAIERRRFREALRHYPTGVAVVTATSQEHGAVGMVVGSFTPVSVQPALVAFMPQRHSPALALLRTGASFCVNVLSAGQEPLCRRFTVDGRDGFAGVNWRPAPSGAPVLEGAVAWFDCTPQSITEAGDHFIVVGRVEAVDVSRRVPPLLSFQGGYGTFTVPSLSAAAEPDLLHGIGLADYARDQIEAVAEEFEAECSVMTPVGEDAVFVAMAVRSAEPSNVSVGFRVPLLPPLGSVFISTMGSVAINAWLDRLPDADEATRTAYIRQLERVRERNYSLSLRGPRSDREMFTAVRDYSSVDRLPEHERRFREIIHETAPLYEPDIEPDEVYDLHSIVVPVVGPMGLVQIALRLANLPRGADGTQVELWTARLREAARVVAERLTAEMPPPGADL